VPSAFCFAQWAMVKVLSARSTIVRPQLIPPA
jgi:hypothetical protein